MAILHIGRGHSGSYQEQQSEIAERFHRCRFLPMASVLLRYLTECNWKCSQEAPFELQTRVDKVSLRDGPSDGNIDWTFPWDQCGWIIHALCDSFNIATIICPTNAFSRALFIALLCMQLSQRIFWHCWNLEGEVVRPAYSNDYNSTNKNCKAFTVKPNLVFTHA